MYQSLHSILHVFFGLIIIFNKQSYGPIRIISAVAHLLVLLVSSEWVDQLCNSDIFLFQFHSRPWLHFVWMQPLKEEPWWWMNSYSELQTVYTHLGSNWSQEFFFTLSHWRFHLKVKIADKIQIKYKHFWYVGSVHAASLPLITSAKISWEKGFFSPLPCQLNSLARSSVRTCCIIFLITSLFPKPPSPDKYFTCEENTFYIWL